MSAIDSILHVVYVSCSIACLVWVVGAVVYYLKMRAEHNRHIRSKKEWDIDPTEPLFHEDAWIILPAMWPIFAYDFLVERFARK